MATRLFKKIGLIVFVLGLLFVVCLRGMGWEPTIANIEMICSYSILVCPFHYLTGFDCPGCGITRALVSFFLGAPVLSFYFHPLGPFVGLGVIVAFLNSLKHDRKLNWHNLLPYRFSWSVLLILIAWGVVRNT